MSSCLKCNSKDVRRSYLIRDIFEDEYHLVECSNCGIYYLNPPPTPEQLNNAYAEDYYGEGEKKFNTWIESVISYLRSLKAKSFSKQLAKNAAILDIGCGNGEFLEYLSKQGDYELHGLEIAGGSAERAKQKKSFQLHIGELKEDTYSAQQFDAIILTHVFEHLSNPENTVDIINKIAKPNAILQIEIPNIRSWQFKLFKRHWLHLDPPRHLHFYNENQLEDSLKSRGWKLRSKSYFSPQFSPFGFQQSLLNSLGIKRELLYESMKGNKNYTKGQSGLGLFFQYLFHYLSLPLFIFADLVASVFSRGATLKIIFKKA